MNIKKSNLNNSPIIINSPKAKVDNSIKKPYKNRRSIFLNPWVVTVGGGIIVGIVLLLIGHGVNMKKKDDAKKVNIQNSNLDKSPVIVDSPGASVDNSTKIDNINIITDKEALGIREKFGLYRDGKKVGDVINPGIDETNNTFSFAEIQFDKPIRNQNFLSTPFEFRNYIIQIQSCQDVVFNSPPGAKGVQGNILQKISK